MMRKENKQTELIKRSILFGIILLEIAVLTFMVIMTTNNVFAGLGGNVTVITRLEVGNSAPEIISLSIDSGNVIDLIPNSTKTVVINALVRDYNGENDINSSKLTFFDNGSSLFSDPDDNNNHYENSTCSIDTSYGDANEVNITCNLYVWYYANNASWNASIFVNDSSGLNTMGSRRVTIDTLLALELPQTIDFGLVNASAVSDESYVNIANMGNIVYNLTLEGYGAVRGDGLAMNCTQGSRNISVYYEKYNLTSSNLSILTLPQFESMYVNLTNVSTAKKYNLDYRQNDTFNEAINQTYWRIYVPMGVAGNCTGSIIFGAIRATGN